MKKIILCLYFFILVGCVGYEPLLSTKNLSFYIENIENINDNPITKKISYKLKNKSLEVDGKRKYILRVNSNNKEIITSKDSRGVAATYEMTINVEVEVFYKETMLPINKFKISKSANYNNQTNKFDLAQYKKVIEENIIDKIAQEITIKLHSL
jgi:outer membrane lipopolysaccharide assembly protein LptE/RlpB